MGEGDAEGSDVERGAKGGEYEGGNDVDNGRKKKQENNGEGKSEIDNRKKTHREKRTPARFRRKWRRRWRS